MVDWPEELVNAVARRKCVLFLGSGVSAGSRSGSGKAPPTWNAFLLNILKKKKTKLSTQEALINKLLNESDFLTACEVIVNAIGEQEFDELAADEFRRPGYKPNDLHEEIYKLDSRIVVTPNVDKIYEQHAMTVSKSTVVAKSYFEEDVAKFLRTNDYLIIRAHGCVDDSLKMIFTQKQYSLARCKYSSFYRLLDALILTHTFVFIGCGIKDPDIQLTLENLNFLYPGCRPHYFITAENQYESEVINVLNHNRNLEVLTYDNSDGIHSNLLLSIKKLNDLVDDERRKLAGSLTW